MNEENAQTLGEKPSKKRRYRNHKDNLKKEANQAKTNLKAGESTQTAQDVESKEQKKSKKRRKNNNPTIKIGGNEEWQKDMKIAIEANKASHELRLEPLKYLNSAEHKIIITPLGGLGEIGGNMTIFETNNDAIIIDIGMSFPTEGMHGVDILVPDFDYVRKIKNKIRGIIITHAHEDHIGAVPYFFKEFQFPIYATPLPLGMISNKFEEHGLKSFRSYFRPIEKRKVYELGDFEFELIHSHQYLVRFHLNSLYPIWKIELEWD